VRDYTEPSGTDLIWMLLWALAVSAYFALRAPRWFDTTRRRRAWQGLADRLGCEFSVEDPFGIPAGATHRAFTIGTLRKAENVLYGRYRGRRIACFDYHFTVGRGHDAEIRYRTLLVVPVARALPPVLIRPETAADRAAALVGIDDIGFESEEFSKRYFVQSSSRRFAYDLLHPTAMAALLDGPALVIEAGDRAFVLRLAVSDRVDVPDGVCRLLAAAYRFLDTLPADLREP
jgi:hypothetical protein